MSCMDALMPRAQGCARVATWAKRLKHVFNIDIDIDICDACGGKLKLIARNICLSMRYTSRVGDIPYLGSLLQ